MVKDYNGLEMTASEKGAAAFNHVIDGYLRLAHDTGTRLKGLLEIDAEIPMAQILKGYFFMLMATRSLRKRAIEIVETVNLLPKSANEREKLHFRALCAWTGGKNSQAIAAWEEILLLYPRDILALRLAHHGYFYNGDSQNLCDVVSRVSHAWDKGMPNFGYVLGMKAFGLEETYAFDAAIRAGLQAIEINPIDPWAIHAVAHVHEMTGEPTEGINWITNNESGWIGCNNFRHHIYWHRALMWLEKREYAKVLNSYDNDIWNPLSEEYLDLCNSASLLMRLELHDVDVGDRWSTLAEKCKNRTDEHILTFADIHFALALLSVKAVEAQDLIASMKCYAESKGNFDDNALVSAEIGIPLIEGVRAYRDKKYQRAIKWFMPIRYHVQRMGGSHAQRDLFAMLLLDSALKADHIPLAKSLAAERMGRLSKSSWTQKKYIDCPRSPV